MAKAATEEGALTRTSRRERKNIEQRRGAYPVLLQQHHRYHYRH